MKCLFFCLLVLSSIPSYSQHTSVSGAVAELRQLIEKNIEPPLSITRTKKSAIVLASVKLTEAGRYVSSILQYNDQSDVYTNVESALIKVKSNTWKKFKGVEHIQFLFFLPMKMGKQIFVLTGKRLIQEK